MIKNYDAIVIGGGLVGTAVAYGLMRLGKKVVILDEGDIAYRASRGNFGLVWVQSKDLACQSINNGHADHQRLGLIFLPN